MKKIYAILVLLTILFSFTALAQDVDFVPPINDGEELENLGYKFSNSSNIIITTAPQIWCAWKTQESDDGFKTCEAIFEVENKNTIKSSIDFPALDFEFSNNDITILATEYSDSFTIEQKDYYSDLEDPETKQTFTKKEFSNYAPLPKTLDTAKPFAIKLTYEAPKYQANQFNLTILGTNFNAKIDPFQSSCGELTQENGTYRLTQDLTSNDTCIVVRADNIGFDCDNYRITGNNSVNEFGINVIADNATIRNCFVKHYHSGIRVSNSYHTKVLNSRSANNTISGVSVTDSSLAFISENLLYNNGQDGLRLYNTNMTLAHANDMYNNKDGIQLIGGTHSNALNNNNLTDNLAYQIDDQSLYGNVLLYNNSYSLINWTKTNLTTNTTLGFNTTLFLHNNLAGYAADATSMNLNSSALLEIYNLAYSSTPRFLKNGERCDQTDLCNISYDSGAGILYANVSSFSNYTTQEHLAPNITLPIILPSPAYTQSTLSANSTYTDPEASLGTIYFLWYVNGNNIFNHTASSISNGTTTLTSLDSGNFSRGDQINLSVYANDGEKNSSTLTSDTITIANTPPVLTSVYLNASSPTNTSAANLTALAQTSDDDSDSVKPIYDWKINNNSVATLIMPFEGGSNATYTKDYSPFNHAITVSEAFFNSTGGFDDFGAYYFDGVDDYVDVNDSGHLDFGTSNFTISLLMSSTLSVSGKYYDLIDKRVSAGNQGFAITYLGKGSNQGAFWMKVGASTFESNIATYAANTIHHVVLRRAGSNVSFFVNGVLDGTFTSSDTLDNTASVRLGKRFNNGLNGSLDEVVIFNRSLSDAQVLALANNQPELIVPQETQVGENWSVLVTPNDRFEDGTTLSSNSVTITDAPTYVHSLVQPTTNSSNYAAYRFIIQNIGLQSYLYNWTFDTSESVISSTQETNLSVGEEVFVFFETDHASGGSITVEAQASTSLDSDTEQADVSVG